MKILLVGKHELSCQVLNFLLTTSHKTEVITSKTEIKTGRDSLKKLLISKKIKPLNKDFSHEELLNRIIKFKPDLLISTGFDKIIKQEILDQIPLCINIHFGMLPKYRGSFSIPWAILNNEKYIGVTLHKIDSGIDSGKIIFQSKIKNNPNNSCRQIYSLAINEGLKLCKKLITNLENNKNLIFKKQNEAKATYYPLEFPENFHINWQQTTTYIFNYIRACYFPPFTPAFTNIESNVVNIHFPVKYKYQQHNKTYGTIVEISNQYWITTLNGLIQPIEITINKKKQNFQNFVKNKKIEGIRVQ